MTCNKCGGEAHQDREGWWICVICGKSWSEVYPARSGGSKAWMKKVMKDIKEEVVRDGIKEVPCRFCGNPVPHGRAVYCTDLCAKQDKLMKSIANKKHHESKAKGGKTDGIVQGA